MDEIDAIIIKSLREIGCEINEEYKTLSCFSPELVVETVSKCLRIIIPDKVVPKSLPSNVMQRYFAASFLAESCLAIGYKEDVGYHTFLYTNLIEIRKLYMFLLEKLPKESFKTYECKTFPVINLHIHNAYSKPWTLQCRRIETKTMVDNHMLFGNYDMFTNKKKPHNDEFIKTLKKKSFCFNEIIKENKIFLCHKTEGAEVNRNAEISPQNRMEEIKNGIYFYKASMKNNFLQQKSINMKTLETQHLCCLKESTITDLNNQKKIMQRMQVILNNHYENMIKMEELITATKNKKEQLIAKFDENRWPIIQAIKNLQQNKCISVEMKCLRKKFKSLQEQSNKIKEDIHKKKALYTILSQEFNGTNVFSHRKMYIHKIMEIIENIRKQNNDINRVIEDINEVKKRITTNAGILDRQFTVTDDALYSMAKRNEYTKRAYKLLAVLHLYCSDLIISIQNTGSVIRGVRELEENIEQEKIKNLSANLARVKHDLSKIDKEKLYLTQIK